MLDAAGPVLYAAMISLLQGLMMSRRRAFTLVELLVVIGIIALLISILLPALSRAQESAKRVACMNNHRQLLMAVRYYCDEWRDAIPFCNSNGIETSTWRHPGWLYDRAQGVSLQEHVKNGLLYKWLRNEKIYHCPFDAPPYVSSAGQTLHELSSYCMNRAVLNQAHPPSYKYGQFKATDVLFWESDEKRAIWNDGTNNPYEGITARHGQSKGIREAAGAIVGCFAGHAEWITVAEFEREATRQPGRIMCGPTYR